MGTLPRIAVGFDVGGTSVKSAVVQYGEQGVEIVTEEQFPTGMLHSVDEFIEYLVRLCGRFRVQWEVQTVGIGFPSCVQWHKGIVSRPPNISWWNCHEFPLRDTLQSQLGLPIVVDNDANCAAIAELTIGVGRQVDSFLFVTLGTGVGGALVLNGKLYRGDNGCAGEIGHIIINMHAPLEQPPYRAGVLERYVGRDGIIARAHATIEHYPDSILRRYGDLLDVSTIGQAACLGDRAAIEIVRETATLLGLGLISALAVTGIEHVIIAGGIAGLPDVFYEELQKTVRARAIPAIGQRATVHRSSLGPQAGMLGAALLGLMELPSEW